jgi:hypothetical protein
LSLELNINYFIYTIKGGVVRPEGSISDSINVISVLNDKHFDKLIKYVKSEFSQTTFVQNNESGYVLAVFANGELLHLKLSHK